MNKIFIFILVILSWISTHSQTVLQGRKEFEWSIIQSLSNKETSFDVIEPTDPFNTTMGDVESSIIYNKDSTEAICLVAFRRKKFGVLLLNNKQQVKWQMNLDGFPMRMIKLKDKIVVITSPAFGAGGKGFAPQYMANLIDENGKLIKTKSIYAGDDELEIDPKFFVVPNENFFRMAVLERPRKGTLQLYRKPNEKYGFPLFQIDAELTTKKLGDLTLEQGSLFQDCTSDANGNIIVATEKDNKTIYVTKFMLNDLKKKQVMSMNYNRQKRSDLSLQLFTGQKSGITYVSVKYANDDNRFALNLYSLNFLTNKQYTHQIVFDNAYCKKMKDDFKPFNKDFDKIKHVLLTRSDVTHVIEKGNELIVWKEAIYAEARSTKDYMWYGGDLTISVYTPELKEISSTIVPREVEFYSPIGRGSSLSVRENKIYFIAGDFTLRNAFALFGIFDLKDKKIESLSRLAKNGIPSVYHVEAKAILWFNNSVLIPYMEPTGLGAVRSLDTHMQAVNIQ